MDTEKRIEELTGTPAEALARQRRMNADVIFAGEHMDEWRKKHPNTWIAVYGKQLLAAESSVEKAIDVAVAAGAPRAGVLIRYLPAKKLILVL